jgi:hypothetical protein
VLHCCDALDILVPLHADSLVDDRRFAGSEQLGHGSPFYELVKIVHFAIRTGVSIENGEVNG